MSSDQQQNSTSVLVANASHSAYEYLTENTTAAGAFKPVDPAVEFWE